MKNTGVILMTAFFLSTSTSVVWSYDPYTHARITKTAFSRSEFANSDSLLWHLGLGVDPSSPYLYQDIRYLNENGSRQRRNLTNIAQLGSINEDTIEIPNFRPINHFFDPISGNGLLVPTAESSPSWALEQDEQWFWQDWSLADAKDYLYEALTDPSEQNAHQKWYSVFFSMGHVIHHVQDMGQPQHSRLDAHLDLRLCGGLSEEWCFYEPSFYEWLSLKMSDGGYSNPVNDLIIPPSIPGDYPNVALYLERDYWTHPAGLGMADYSNRSFVTVETNYLRDEFGNNLTNGFAQPGLAGWVEEEYDGSNLRGRNGEPLSGLLRLVKAPLSDTYLGTGQETTHATSSYTLFSHDIRDAIDAGVPARLFDGRNYFYLNRINLQSANDHLYRRAIGYSAGFIDHVFRGRLEIAPPEGNIYSVIDHAVTNEPPEGFTSIKLKLRNATEQQNSPDSSTFNDGHVMKTGKLVAVALFRPNICYTQDLRGELDEDMSIANGCSISDWLRTEQHRVVSAEIDLPNGLGLTEFVDFEFDFSANPIPVNARDLSIQVVFRGRLGGDLDALAVARKEISEPTWFGGLNNTDYIAVDGFFQNAEEFLASPEARDWGIFSDEDRIAHGPQTIPDVLYVNLATGEHLTEWAPLDELQYHRLALLTEPDEMIAIRASVFFQEFVHEISYWFTPVITWLQEEPEITHLPGYGDIVRNVRRWYYTPIDELRNIPGRMMVPHHLYLGAWPEMSERASLPQISNPGPPQPVPLHAEE